MTYFNWAKNYKTTYKHLSATHLRYYSTLSPIGLTIGLKLSPPKFLTSYK